jgi:hypothetical protein
MGDVVSIAAVVTKEHWDEHRDKIVAAVVRAREAAQAALGTPEAMMEQPPDQANSVDTIHIRAALDR